MTLKLGYVVPEFPGQTHAFFWREVTALERMGVNVSLISTRPPLSRMAAHEWAPNAIARTDYLAPLPKSDLPMALPAALGATISGFSPRMVPQDRLWFLKNAAPHAPFARRLVRLAAEKRLDHIHVHSCARAALVAMLARRIGLPPYSLTLHGPLLGYGPGQRTKWRDAAFVTVITEKLKNEVQKTLTGVDLPPIVVQPMGVDTDRFARHTPYNPPKRDAPLRIFSCGRLNRVKGHEVLIEAVAALASRGIDAHLEIAGEDDHGGAGLRQTLEALIDKRGVTNRVTLLGSVSEDRVHSGLLDAHIFALASNNEALGVAYMEAMSCELPVIGTNTGGVSELITSGHDGLLVPPKDSAALVEAVERLIDAPEMAERLGQAGRKTVLERFGATRGAQALINSIHQIPA